MKKEIMNCLTWYANQIEMACRYWKNPTDTYSEIKTAQIKFLEEIKKHIDFSKLTKEEAVELRFGKWTDESNLYLIPIYLLPILPIGIELTAIDGEKVVYDGKNVDDDTRMGCLAYGIVINE